MTTADLIFQRWKAELEKKDRTHSKVSDNFGDLFADLYQSQVSFQEAHTLLDKAVIAHLPNDSITRTVYKRVKSTKIDKTYEEFVKGWKNLIESKAVQAFYDLYPLNGASEEDRKILVQEYVIEGEDGKKVRKEDLIQDAYIESFPLIDVQERIRELERIQKELDEEDLIPVIEDER